MKKFFLIPKIKKRLDALFVRSPTMFFRQWWKKRKFSEYLAIRDRVMALRSKIAAFSDEQLQKKIAAIRRVITSKRSEEERKKSLDSYLVLVFAIAREVIYRKTGKLLFSTQILGGVVLHYGNVAQMNTGEGKTLAAFPPACLNALGGKVVFVLTANEYLAQRDWNEAKEILAFFGVSSGVNLSHLSTEQKRQVYECKVIYTTCSELGFDYLRNNLVYSQGEELKMKFEYCIIDEIDNSLIDNSRESLNISHTVRPGETVQAECQKATELARALVRKVDYTIDLKRHSLWLSEAGVRKIENHYRLSNLFSFENHDYNLLIHNALKVKHFYRKNVEYIVKEDRIILIDPLTGRLLPKSVYGAGIHQAIESKEGVPLERGESKNIATITLQNLFRMFEKISGMTGTALSEEDEFNQVYGLEVVEVPPFKELIRRDYDDLIFADKLSKYRAIVAAVKRVGQTTKQPILIGCADVESSERLSSLLKLEGVFHHKLNAINHEEEATIISNYAGELGSVTISTAMAGRGTDIKLSKESIKAGGLFVIGDENDSTKRSRLQLIGRAGRHGEPGKSRFYVSLEDELISRFGLKNRLQGVLEVLSRGEPGKPISGKFLNFLISEPQETIKNTEAFRRQSALSYDLLIARQREFVYRYRRAVLRANSWRETLELVSRKALSLFKAGARKEISSFRFEYLKSNLLYEIDDFWTEYLEVVEKSRELVKVKIYLPQDPKEAFFLETLDLFKQGLKQLRKNLFKQASRLLK